MANRKISSFPQVQPEESIDSLKFDVLNQGVNKQLQINKLDLRYVPRYNFNNYIAESIVDGAQYSDIANTAKYAANGDDIALSLANKVDKEENARLITLEEVSIFNNKQNALGFTPENAANRNVNNGYCGLDSGGKVPINNLPTTLLKYVGVWNAATNTPTLSSVDTTKKGNVYNVGTAGTQFGITWKLGDWLIYNESGVAEKSDNSDDVTSVNGQTGTVSITLDDLLGVKIEKAASTSLLPRAGSGENPDPYILYFADVDDSGILSYNDGLPHFYQYISALDTYVLQGQALGDGGEISVAGAPMAVVTYDSGGIPELGVNRANYAVYDNSGNDLSSLFNGTGGSVANAAYAVGAGYADTANSANTATYADTAGSAPNYSSGGNIESALNGKQASLSSGVNIKTINNQSILGAGNMIISGGGGTTGMNVYLSATASSTGGYNKVLYQPNTTQSTATINANNSTVWGTKYLTDLQVGSVVIESGTWEFHLYHKVSTASGVSKAKARVIRYLIGGTESLVDNAGAALPEWTSEELNSLTDYTFTKFKLEANELAVNKTDRIAIQLGFETTHTSNVTLTYGLGEDYASHIIVPFVIRHDSLRGINDNPIYQHINLDNTIVSSAIVQANLITVPNSFDDGLWEKYVTTVTPNTTLAPDGTMTADTLTAAVGVLQHNIARLTFLTGGITYKVSIYAKAGTHSYFGIGANNSFGSIRVNLSTGAIMAGSGTVEDFGSGWWRINTTVFPGGALGVFFGFIDASQNNSFSTNGTETMILWGARVEPNATAVPDILTLTANKPSIYTGLQVNNFTVALGTPTSGIVNKYELFFNTGTSIPTVTWPSNIVWINGSAPILQTSKKHKVEFINNGNYISAELKVEGYDFYQHENLSNTVTDSTVITRKNLFDYTDEIDNAYWTNAAGMITPNVAIHPLTGLQTAEGIILPASTSSKDIMKLGIVISSGAAYYLSFYIKRVTSLDWIEATINNNGTYIRSFFNINTGVKGSGVGAMESAGYGWYRCSVPFTSLSTSCGLYITPRTGNGVSSNSPAGDGVTVVANIAGLQLEQNSVVTSYQQISGAATIITLTANKPNIYTGLQINPFTVSLGQPLSGIVNKYDFYFATGATVPVITWPSGITWMSGLAPVLQPNKKYEVKFTNNGSYISAKIESEGYVNGLIYATAAQKSIANTNVEISLFNSTAFYSTVNIREIPANGWQLHKPIRIKMKGYYSCIANQTANLRLKIGGVEVFNLVETFSTSGQSNMYFDKDFTIAATALGSSGTVKAIGRSHLLTSANAEALAPASGSITVNTTTSKVIDMTFQWTTANAGNILNIETATIEVF